MKPRFNLIAIFCITILFFSVSYIVSAQATPRTYDYQPLAPLPNYVGGDENIVKTDDIGKYILNVYLIAVSLSGVLAVFMIVFGGVEIHDHRRI